MRFGKNSRTRALEAVANAPIGAAVSVEGSPATILGTIIFDEGGDMWVEHLIGFGNGQRLWLSVENFDTTVATLWYMLDAHAVSGGPDEKQVAYRDAMFRRSESGLATYRAKGDLGLNETGSIHYADFNDEAGTRISFERYGEPGAGRRSIAVAGNCPNCGAALRVDAYGYCSSCGSAVTDYVGEWYEWETAFGRDVTHSTHLC